MSKINELNIVMCSDENYSMHMGICIKSIFVNNSSDFGNINIYILDTGISDDSKDKIMQLSREEYENCSVNVVFYDISEALDTIEVSGGVFTKNIFGRYFISEYLPSDIKKVLYLDCDIVVCDSLTDLYSLDLSDCLLYAGKDILGITHNESIGLDNKYPYVNSGVLLINLEQWKRQSVGNTLINETNKSGDKYEYCDQDIINLLYAEQIKVFPIEYNVVSSFYQFGKGYLRFITETDVFFVEKIELAKRNPVILHYSVQKYLRPWHIICYHPKKDAYLKYKNMSPWNGTPLIDNRREYKERFIQTINIFIFKHIPYSLSEFARNIYRLVMKKK